MAPSSVRARADADDDNAVLTRSARAKKGKTESQATSSISVPLFKNLHPPKEDDIIVDSAIALRSFFRVVDSIPADNLLRLHFGTAPKICGKLFMATAALMTLLGHNRYDISESPAGVMYVSTRSVDDAVMLESQNGVPGAIAGSSDPRHDDATAASNSFLLGLESMRAEIKEAVRCSQSANDAWLETRRDVADLSVFLNNQHHHREPTTQDYLAALRLAPDAFAAIKWPITSVKEFKVAVLAALDARGVAVDELVALGMLTAPCLTAHPRAKSSGKRKAPDEPTEASSHGVLLTRKANKLAALIVDGVTNNRLLDRCWVELQGNPVVYVTGIVLKLILTGEADLDVSFCDAASRMMNRIEAVKFACGHTEAPRCFMPPTFVHRVLSRIQSDVALVDILANSTIEFNVRACMEFVAVVPAGNGWACYAWGFSKRNFTLIDPLAHGMTVQEVKNKHRATYEALFHKLTVHAIPAIRDAPWTEVIHTDVGGSCPRNSTGIYSVLAAKIVDCNTGEIALDHFDMAQCTRNIVYSVVDLDDNKTKIPDISSLYGATKLPVPLSLVRK